MDLPEDWEQQLMDALIELGCQRDSVVPEYPNGAEGPLEANPEAQVHIAFNPRGAGIEFTGGVWLFMKESQERKIEQLSIVFPSQFEHGLQEAKVALKNLLDSL